MIDIAAAKSAAGAVAHLQGSNITNALPMVTMMAKWSNQVIGAYDLIFPHLHKDYPMRNEVELLVKQTIALHHLTNWHLPVGMSVTGSPGSPLGLPGSTTDIKTLLVPKEVFVNKVLVRAGSPVNSIGYGI